jgi:hypothetical protein
MATKRKRDVTKQRGHLTLDNSPAIPELKKCPISHFFSSEEFFSWCAEIDFQTSVVGWFLRFRFLLI